MNPLNRGSGDNGSVSMPELKSLDGWDESLKKDPDVKYYVEYDFYTIDNEHYHKPGLYGFYNGKSIRCSKTTQRITQNKREDRRRQSLSDILPTLHSSSHFSVTDKKQQLLTPQLNHISLKLQPFPLLSQRNQITPDMFCNESTVSNCEEEHCECTHVVQVSSPHQETPTSMKS